MLALAFSAWALAQPDMFTWIRPHIPKFLGVIMFGMGLTLEFSDFRKVWQARRLVLIGTCLQYTIMPSTAWLVATVLQLPKDAFIGTVIVGACPGGTASNVITYLAGANVALSVVLTLASTLLAPIMTPGIIYIFLRQKVHVEFLPLMESVFWIVVFPVIDGLVIRRFLRRRMERFIDVFPSVSILGIVLVIASIMALNQRTILGFPLRILLSVILHNGLGLLLGYYGARLFRADIQDRRTISIEVGMQNSGLGVALAAKFFDPTSALPAAIFSLWHNLSGIILANIWARRGPKL